MSTTNDPPLSPAVAGDPAIDLSADICRAVAREPGDIVRCTHIQGSFYRCNWWQAVSEASFDNPNVRGSQLGTTFRVRRSEFLDVARIGADLRIREASARRTYPTF